MAEPTTDACKLADAEQAPPTMPPEEPPPPIEEIVTREVVEDVVKGYDPNFELVDWSAKLGTAAGDNYMSIMYAVEINIKSKKTAEKKTFHIMLKTMPRHTLRQEMITQIGAFVKESKLYDEIFPAFMEFQNKMGVKKEDQFTQFPKCYATFCNGKTDYIAMEDLRAEGFKMGDRHRGLDFAHCTAVVKNMAKYHAISFAMYKGDYATIKETYPYLEEKMAVPAAQMPDMMKMYFNQSFKKEADILREAGHEELAKSIESLARDEFIDENHRLVGCPVKNAVIGHGDCWTNNFLFKYGDAGEPIDIKFLDFQLSRPSSRAIDLSYFLHTSPQFNVMNDRHEELLRVYYDEFTSFAKKLGFEDKQLTFQNFLDEYFEFKLYGVVMGLLIAPAVSAQKEDVPDMENMPTEYSAEAFDGFMDNIMKGDIILKKLHNLTKNHAIKLPFVADYLKNNK